MIKEISGLGFHAYVSRYLLFLIELNATTNS